MEEVHVSNLQHCVDSVYRRHSEIAQLVRPNLSERGELTQLLKRRSKFHSPSFMSQYTKEEEAIKCSQRTQCGAPHQTKTPAF